MIKIVKRNEEGYKMIGLRWREAFFANRGIEAILRIPESRDGLHPKHRFVAMLQWGPGAGYVGGLTAYFGFRCKDLRGHGFGRRIARNRANGKYNMYVNVPFQFGVTQNANVIPYPY